MINLAVLAEVGIGTEGAESACGGSSISGNLASSTAIRRAASAALRLGLKASGSNAASDRPLLDGLGLAHRLADGVVDSHGVSMQRL